MYMHHMKWKTYKHNIMIRYARMTKPVVWQGPGVAVVIVIVIGVARTTTRSDSDKNVSGLWPSSGTARS